LLIKQVSHPVLWEQSINKMINEGIDAFIEIGPGNTLTGFMKRIDKTKAAFNFQDEVSLSKLLTSMGGL